MTLGELKETRNKPPYMSNKELLIIAVLSGIGGVMSTYIGYLANLLNRLFGVPFGAGQFVAGLHVFWIMVVAGLIRKPGAATIAGLLKGVVEFLTGGTHGIAIIIVSLVQGILVDVVLLIFRKHNLFTYAIAGGIAAASNVLVFQILYFSGAPIYYILFIALLAFISGILLAGSFGHSILAIIMEARPFQMPLPEDKKEVKKTKLNLIVAGTLFIAFAGGAVYYYAAVYEPPWVGPSCQVEGQVENTISFQLSHFAQHEKTIAAELRGQVTFIPEQNYTGIPVAVILEKARPMAEANTVKVIAKDGYMVEFPLADVLNDDDMLLIEEEDMLRLIAANYEGGYWVKQVARFQVE